MPLWKKAVGLTLTAAAALVTFAAVKYVLSPGDDLSRLQGDWQLAVPASARDGAPAARAVRGVTVRFTGNTCVWLVGDQEQKRYAVELRPEAKEIDLTQLRSDGTPLIQRWPPPERPVMLRGIYSIDGSQVRVVVGNGDEERPADLNATDGVTVWVLERK